MPGSRSSLARIARRVIGVIAAVIRFAWELLGIDGVAEAILMSFFGGW